MLISLSKSGELDCTSIDFGFYLVLSETLDVYKARSILLYAIERLWLAS